MKALELINRAEALTDELVTQAGSQGLSPLELLQVVAMSERLIQRSCFPDNQPLARTAVATGHAMYEAVTQNLDVN